MNRLRTALTAFLVLVTAAVLPAQDDGGVRYGRIAADNVRVYCGSNAYDAEIGRLMKGDPVEIVAAQGDWVELRIPGGLRAHVARRSGARDLVELTADGRARVLVDDLLLRPKPNTDWPAMGRVAKDRELKVLGETEGWLEVQAPSEETAFVMSRYVTEGADQAELARAFAQRDVAGVADPLETPAATSDAETGAGSPAAATPRTVTAQDEPLEAELAELDARLEELTRRDAAPATSDLVRLRASYQDLASRAPEDSDLRARAERRAAFVAERELVSGKLGDADERLRRLAEQMEKSEAGYADELAEIRRRRQAELAARKDRERPTRFLEYGIGEIYKDYGDSIGDRPTFMLVKAGERRFRLVSERYDLGEYHGKTIGITGWEDLNDGDGGRFPKIMVTRLEILP